MDTKKNPSTDRKVKSVSTEENDRSTFVHPSTVHFQYSTGPEKKGKLKIVMTYPSGTSSIIVKPKNFNHLK